MLQAKLRIIIITSNDHPEPHPGSSLRCRAAGGDWRHWPPWRGAALLAGGCSSSLALGSTGRERHDHRGRRGERVRGRHPAGRREVRPGQRDHEQPEHGPAHVRGERLDRPPGQRGPARGAERPGLRHVHGHDREGRPRLRRATTIVVQKLLGLPDSTPNPHLWYEPATMPAVASAIAADLAAIQPAHAAYFKANATAFTSSLGRVDQRDRGVQAALPGHAGGHHRTGGGLPAAGASAPTTRRPGPSRPTS